VRVRKEVSSPACGLTCVSGVLGGRADAVVRRVCLVCRVWYTSRRRARGICARLRAALLKGEEAAAPIVEELIENLDVRPAEP
jgi:hypothetical protein